MLVACVQHDEQFFRNRKQPFQFPAMHKQKALGKHGK